MHLSLISKYPVQSHCHDVMQNANCCINKYHAWIILLKVCLESVLLSLAYCHRGDRGHVGVASLCIATMLELHELEVYNYCKLNDWDGTRMYRPAYGGGGGLPPQLPCLIKPTYKSVLCWLTLYCNQSSRPNYAVHNMHLSSCWQCDSDSMNK